MPVPGVEIFHKIANLLYFVVRMFLFHEQQLVHLLCKSEPTTLILFWFGFCAEEVGEVDSFSFLKQRLNPYLILLLHPLPF